MPELPEVELFRRTLQHTSTHRRIEAVRIDRHAARILHPSAAALRRRLLGRAFASTRRHGKLLFAGLDDGSGALVIHFGMTGFLVRYREGAPGPDHPRLVLHLDDGHRLAYDCQRLLGRIDFAPDVDAWIEKHRLGPDALAISTAGLSQRLAGARGSLKAALMDQQRIAGIGNVYSDEILFQARLHPRAATRRLGEKALRRLHRSLRRVLREAIRYRANPDRMPRSWLMPHRGEKGARCPRCRAPLARIAIGGRSSWLCETCQKKP